MDRREPGVRPAAAGRRLDGAGGLSRRLSQGTVVYRTDFVRNPAYRSRGQALLSDELRAKVRRHNIPVKRIVQFDGKHSRTDVINTDYEVTGPSIELRSVERADTYVYCKRLLNTGFCVEHPVNIPVSDHPPVVRPTSHTATIAGLLSRRAEYVGGPRLLVWFTEELEVVDPTHAVTALPGVPGFVTRMQETSDSDRVDAFERVTVTEISADPPPPGAFALPFSMFPSIEEAREEDRRLLQIEGHEELRHRPLDAVEREMFVGDWDLATRKDRIEVAIRRGAHDTFTFKTTIATAPARLPGRETIERATMVGRALLVESPPNYRLYRLADDGKVLAQVGSEIFKFKRLEQQSGRHR